MLLAIAIVLATFAIVQAELDISCQEDVECQFLTNTDSSCIQNKCVLEVEENFQTIDLFISEEINRKGTVCDRNCLQFAPKKQNGFLDFLNWLISIY